MCIRDRHIGLHGSVKGFTPELSMALRVPGMIKLALCTAYGALQRTESRGAHTREDFPARNDAEWLTRTLAYWKEGDSLPTLKYEDASPWFELPPGERGYGGGKIIPAEIPADKIKTKEQAEEAIQMCIRDSPQLRSGTSRAILSPRTTSRPPCGRGSSIEPGSACIRGRSWPRPCGPAGRISLGASPVRSRWRTAMWR